MRASAKARGAAPLLVVGVGAVLVLLGAVPASADEAPATSVPLTVVLMGDSYTAGNGARDEAGNEVYFGPERCRRSTAAWGAQYADALGRAGYDVTLLNRACSASTTDAVLHDRDMRDSRLLLYPEPEPLDAPLDDQPYLDWARTQDRCLPAPATEEYMVAAVHRDPVGDGTADVMVTCERWLHAQVDALNPDVDLVLLTVGGNDLGFPDLVRECLVLGNAGTCARQIDSASKRIDTDLSDRVTAVLREINRRTEGHAEVAYVAYPELEVNDSLTLTGLVGGAPLQIDVGARFAQMSAAALVAQRDAVERANAAAGRNEVTLVDGTAALFDGHEPDARPAVRNANRWMLEAFDSAHMDEWYHLNPSGHRALAEYVATFGAFGASSSGPSARDVAVMIDASGGGQAGLAEVRDAVGSSAAWAGARVSVIEQRVAADGVSLERRLLVSGQRPDAAVTELAHRPDAPWLPAADVTLAARWNASSQVVWLGSSDGAGATAVPVWTGAADNRSVRVQRLDAPVGGLAAALADAAALPHAWSGGPYVVPGDALELTTVGSSDEPGTTAAWDIDGDGVFETRVHAGRALVSWPRGSAGWVTLQVTAADGSVALTDAWVASGAASLVDTMPCLAGDGDAAAKSSDGRPGCGRQPSGTWTVGDDEVSPPAGEGTALWGDGGERHEPGSPVLAALSAVPMAGDERVLSSESGRTVAGSRRNATAREAMRSLMRVHAARRYRAGCGVAAVGPLRARPPVRTMAAW